MQDSFCKSCGTQLMSGAKFCHQCGTAATQAPTETPANMDIYGHKTQAADNQLFEVTSKVNNFRYDGLLYDNLRISWFVADRETPPVPFEEVIVNYLQLNAATRAHPENYIKERFTGEEAQMLKDYLSNKQKVAAEITELHLPVPSSESGYHSRPPAAGTDFFKLHERSGYPLPFKVEGIFNIKLADERIVPDNRATVISRRIADLANNPPKKDG